MLDKMEIGFAAAKAEWDAFELQTVDPRPYTKELWNQLTFGEQQRYGAQECQTKGAVYTSRIRANKIEFSVTLPSDLTLNGLTENEAKWLERALHKKMEETIVWIIRGREFGVADRPPKKNGLNGLF